MPSLLKALDSAGSKIRNAVARRHAEHIAAAVRAAVNGAEPPLGADPTTGLLPTAVSAREGARDGVRDEGGAAGDKERGDEDEGGAQGEGALGLQGRAGTNLTGGIGGATQYWPYSTEPVPPIFWRLGGKILGTKRPKFGADIIS